ncbi:MAG: LPS-assembly protein LptD [Deltaproteobacteria bacterium]|nr:LPS-assembly protein LptD [Deltaproteobacteria bacterium]
MKGVFVERRVLLSLIVSIFIIFSFVMVDTLIASEIDVARGPINIEADSLSYDSSSETYRAEGNVIIIFAGGTLKADRVSLNKATSRVVAEGGVVVKSGKDVLQGERVSFDIATKRGVINGGTLFLQENNLYLSGSEIEKTGDASYSLVDARVTTCEGEVPDWRFAGKKVEVTIDGYGSVKDGTFQVRNVPLLYFPYLRFPAKTTRQSGFLFPYIAHSSDKLGWDMELPFFWAISERVDATLYQRYMDKRGFQEGAEFRYCIGDHSFGSLYGSYLNDTKRISEENSGYPNRDWQDGQERWSYYLNHETEFTPGFYLRADISKVSDSWFFRDFDSYNYYLVHYGPDGDRFKRVSFLGDKSLTSLDSKARLVKEWDLVNLTALVRYTDDFLSYSNDETVQKYPEITLAGIKQPLFETPFYVNLESVYDYYYREKGERGHLLDLYPVISLPLYLGEYLTFEPEVGFRETIWDADNNDSGEGSQSSRALVSAGAVISTEVSRIFSTRLGTIEKVRHGVKPELAYTYIPSIDQEDIPDFADEIPEANLVNFSVTNTLTARLKDAEGKVSYRELFRLKLGQDFNISEARRDIEKPGDRRRPFGDITIEMDLNPFRFLALDSDAVIDVNAGEWKELNGRLDISDERGDSLTSEYRYTKDDVEELNLSARAKVAETLDLLYGLRRNELYEKDLETKFGIDYHRQCWGIELSYRDSDDDRSVMAIFSLYGLGRAGSSQNW